MHRQKNKSISSRKGNNDINKGREKKKKEKRNINI